MALNNKTPWHSANILNPVPTPKICTNTKASNLAKSHHPAQNSQKDLPLKSVKSVRTIPSIIQRKRISQFWLQKCSKWNFQKIRKESEREIYIWLFLDKEERERYKKYNLMTKTKDYIVIWRERINRLNFQEVAKWLLNFKRTKSGVQLNWIIATLSKNQRSLGRVSA